MTEHTDDGRYIVVAGRRWRATDPMIPAERAAELALGERGTPWWEQTAAERQQRWETEVPLP
jgi:hypothetical protein